MARGPRKHLKRLNAPHAWALSKMGGVFAPRPTSGPHKLRESVPLLIILRNRLKFALTGKEVQAILMGRTVFIDGRVRTDPKYPAGFMDVLSIPKTNQNWRILYDCTGRFAIHPIVDAEAKYKLCRVQKMLRGLKGIPYLVTNDGRTIRYPDPSIKKNDTVKVDVSSGKIVEFVKMDSGNLCMVTGGRNVGRVGTIVSRERHKGSFDIVHIKDAGNQSFATRLSNVFVLGKGQNSLVTLPKRKGLKLGFIQDRESRLNKKKAKK